MSIEFEEEDGEEYEPEPVLIHEGSILILDPVEFAEKFNADAIWECGGTVFVLDRDTQKWRNVEAASAPNPGLKRVQ